MSKLLVQGVSRVCDNDKVVMVAFDRRFSDDELRAVHEALRALPSRPATADVVEVVKRWHYDVQAKGWGKSPQELLRAILDDLPSREDQLRELDLLHQFVRRVAREKVFEEHSMCTTARSWRVAARSLLAELEGV